MTCGIITILLDNIEKIGSSSQKEVVELIAYLSTIVKNSYDNDPDKKTMTSIYQFLRNVHHLYSLPYKERQNCRVMIPQLFYHNRLCIIYRTTEDVSTIGLKIDCLNDKKMYDSIVGFMSYHYNPDEMMQNRLLIHHIFIKPDFRRQGLATSLLENLIDSLINVYNRSQRLPKSLTLPVLQTEVPFRVRHLKFFFLNGFNILRNVKSVISFHQSVQLSREIGEFICKGRMDEDEDENMTMMVLKGIANSTRYKDMIRLELVDESITRLMVTMANYTYNEL